MEEARLPKPGETVEVHVRITETRYDAKKGRNVEKTRIQVFKGIVISARKGENASFTVRKVSYGVGVEQIFPFPSPHTEKIVVVGKGRVRRAKLNYLRGTKGKKFRLKEIKHPVEEEKRAST